METDWLQLWRDLVVTASHSSKSKLVSRYKARAHKRNERPDELLNFVLEKISGENTVLDIGAGSGRWTIPIARIARSVTALEPSPGMLDILRENVATAQLNNIQIMPSPWEEAIIETHDISVCAHAMYSSPDFSSFIRKIQQYTRKACYLAIRLPPCDGIINELSLSIYGRCHDSPNAIIAYNALYSMGIYANVLVEDDIYRWVNNTIDEAFARVKRHLRLEASDAHDKLIRNTLARRLSLSDNCYVWPDGMRSALLWWSPPSNSQK